MAPAPYLQPDSETVSQTAEDRRKNGRIARIATAGGAWSATALSVYILSQVGQVHDQQTAILAAQARQGEAIQQLSEVVSRVGDRQEVTEHGLASTRREYDARLDACTLARVAHGERLDQVERELRDPLRRPDVMLADVRSQISAAVEGIKTWTINVLSERLGALGLRQPGAQSRLEQLGAAIAQLDREDVGSWTRDTDPKPRVDALRRITGTPVGPAERDAAWTLYRLPTASRPDTVEEPDMPGSNISSTSP